MSKDVQLLLTGPLYPLVMTTLSDSFTAHLPWQTAPMKEFLAKSHPEIRGVASNGSHGPLGAAQFDQLPNLEIVSNFGVGYDNVDVVEAKRRGIVVTNTPDVLTDEVADLTLGLLLATVRQIPRAEQYLRAGSWAAKPFPLSATLRGRTVGIIGLGRIGKAIATRCAAFGLPIAYHGRSKQADVPYAYHASPLELAHAVDVLIVVAPGGEETRHMVDAEVLAALGADGVFINVARGSVVDEDALIAALESKTILAAGLDVYENEPRIREDFMTLENAVVLPHIGSASVQTRNAMGQLVIDNLTSWFAGKGPLTPVN
ncbi:2-hydroxyacid dehydrogenase [soil metagenome]